jgi:hypothetical protein
MGGRGNLSDFRFGIADFGLRKKDGETGGWGAVKAGFRCQVSGLKQRA